MKTLETSAEKAVEREEKLKEGGKEELFITLEMFITLKENISVDWATKIQENFQKKSKLFLRRPLNTMKRTWHLWWKFRTEQLKAEPAVTWGMFTTCWVTSAKQSTIMRKDLKLPRSSVIGVQRGELTAISAMLTSSLENSSRQRNTTR